MATLAGILVQQFLSEESAPDSVALIAYLKTTLFQRLLPSALEVRPRGARRRPARVTLGRHPTATGEVPPHPHHHRDLPCPHLASSEGRSDDAHEHPLVAPQFKHL